MFLKYNDSFIYSLFASSVLHQTRRNKYTTPKYLGSRMTYESNAERWDLYRD